jgi:hypothetical protein
MNNLPVSTESWGTCPDPMARDTPTALNTGLSDVDDAVDVAVATAVAAAVTVTVTVAMSCAASEPDRAKLLSRRGDARTRTNNSHKMQAVVYQQSPPETDDFAHFRGKMAIIWVCGLGGVERRNRFTACILLTADFGPSISGSV